MVQTSIRKPPKTKTTAKTSHEEKKRKNNGRYVLSPVEKIALEKSGYELIYPPEERIPVIEVENFPSLGRLTAVRFLEWVLQNPEGVISLPTGKTPEYFIKFVLHYLKNWDKKEVRNTLEEMGLSTEKKPEMKGLRFVQIDEFYPIESRQHNSFYYYVNKYYIKGFGLDPARALLIDPSHIGLMPGQKLRDIFPDYTVDLSLRVRKAQNLMEKRQQRVLQGVDQFCTDYEQRIRDMGGIGFFLGGIGPDGHVAFNVKGSDHFSTTRLAETNYETKAAAAGDLGGIEVARHKHVITIGLSTICYNPNAVAIVIAAGEAKANVVAKTIQSDISNQRPGSALSALAHARFYLTRGAACQLTNRIHVDFIRKPEPAEEDIHRIVMDLSLETGKPIRNLSKDDFFQNRMGASLLEKSKATPDELKERTLKRILSNLNRGKQLIENKVYLHTAPHHDDIILGYLPYFSYLVRRTSTKHYFAYMTSGFNAVTNRYMYGVVEDLLFRLRHGEFNDLLKTDYFEPGNLNARRIDTSYYLEGAARHHDDKKDEATARRFLRNMIEIFEDDSAHNLQQRLTELQNYFRTQYPGKKDIAIVQQLKGRMREWESDLKWAYYGFTGEAVRHLRLGFYKGDIFTEIPTVDRDVPPILKLLQEVNPDIVSVAFDPEGSGPDTHYKVLQAVAQTLRIYEEKSGRSDLQVLGYRNVWFKFHPSESNFFVPASLAILNDLDSAFDTCFNTQKTASFPSYEYDGPFSRLARKIQVKQFEQVKTFLGEEYFIQNEDHGMRACRGIVYLREMSLPEFYSKSEELKHIAEDM